MDLIPDAVANPLDASSEGLRLERKLDLRALEVREGQPMVLSRIQYLVRLGLPHRALPRSGIRLERHHLISFRGEAFGLYKEVWEGSWSVEKNSLFRHSPQG